MHTNKTYSINNKQFCIKCNHILWRFEISNGAFLFYIAKGYGKYYTNGCFWKICFLGT